MSVSQAARKAADPPPEAARRAVHPRAPQRSLRKALAGTLSCRTYTSRCWSVWVLVLVG